MKTNHLFRFAAVLMLSCVLFGCSKNDNTVNTGSIYGIVTVTGEPLKGIGVSLFVDGALLLKTVTYEDGHYEFSDLQPREYFLDVEAEGYEEFSTTVIVESGRQSRADMQLTLVETGMDVITYEAVVSGNSALLKGNYSYDYYSPNEFGFYYSTSTPVTDGTKVKTNDNEYANSGYDFKVNVPDLMPGTYYVQAYAKNNKGTAYGDIKTFVISGDPFVNTLDATNVTQSTATLNGEIVFPGNPAFTERGFVYSRYFSNPTIEDPESSTTRKVVSGTSTLFSANVDNLTNNVTYHVRAYATNANVTVYGESVEFSTADPNANIISIPTLGLMIQKYDISSGADWSTAKSLCDNSTVSGYTDWRLPTKGELQSLYSYGVSVNWNTNSVGYFYHNSDSDSKYWSGTTSGSSSYPYYYVKMYNGNTDYVSGSNTYRVRAVRNL